MVSKAFTNAVCGMLDYNPTTSQPNHFEDNDELDLFDESEKNTQEPKTRENSQCEDTFESFENNSLDVVIEKPLTRPRLRGKAKFYKEQLGFRTLIEAKQYIKGII